ncbi:MAG: gliding motility-associated C-terminal domain-containing protein [Spirosomataceae bacterium]
MRKFIYIIYFLAFLKSITVYADHIIGGNVEMIALDNTPGRYKIIVKMYYDRLKIRSSDYGIPISIYRKSDKKNLTTFAVWRVDSLRRLLNFTNKNCAVQNKVQVVFDYFEREITLDPAVYNDPGGYAIVSNACCRSQELTNITFPDKRGIPFYAEFPPLVKNGKPFINSSPEFKEIDSEYICLGDAFTFPFDATDRDSDELRYSLVTPLSFYDFEFGRNYSASFPPIVTEYIEWQPGYSATNAIRGNPPLSIDAKTGELSVKANEIGLFTFTVLVEEYRNGERIGASRRDYQFFVFDCPPLIPPDPVITVNGQPASEASDCVGGTVQLRATENAAWGYQWQKDGVSILNATTASLDVKEAGDYQLVTYLQNQCSKTRRSRKIKVDFTTTTFKLKSTGPPRICLTNGKFALESPANANYTYEWYKDGQKLSASQSNYTVTEPGSYWAIINDIVQGCTSRSDTVKIQTVPPTVVNITNSSSGQICPGTSATLSVTNNAVKSFQWTSNGQNLPNETKNALIVSQAGEYNVTVIDTNGCQASGIAAKIEVVNKITVTFDSLPNFCGTDYPPLPLKASPSGGSFSGKGVVNNQFDPKTAGVGTHTITYSIKGSLACQSGEAVRTLVITPPPLLNLGRDREIFKGASIELKGDLGAGYRYTWTPPTGLTNPTAAMTSAAPEATTFYTLRAEGPNGCIAVDTILVRVITTIHIPEAFTPNGDGINDTWELRGLENYPEAEVSLYNRWGNAIFFGKGSTQRAFDGKFNGEALPTGVYVYVIKTKPADGYEFRGAVLLLK